MVQGRSGATDILSDKVTIVAPSMIAAGSLDILSSEGV